MRLRKQLKVLTVIPKIFLKKSKIIWIIQKVFVILHCKTKENNNKTDRRYWVHGHKELAANYLFRLQTENLACSVLERLWTPPYTEKVRTAWGNAYALTLNPALCFSELIFRDYSRRSKLYHWKVVWFRWTTRITSVM